MKIGLDYGGVISFAPDGWAKTLRKAMLRGHEIYLISHAQPGSDLQLRKDYAAMLGITDLSFADLRSGHDEVQIAVRKAEICYQHEIQIFVDDDSHRTEAVTRMCGDKCISLYVPQSLWQVGQRLIDGLAED